MLGTFRKWIFILVIVGVTILLGILGFNLFINYRTYTFKRTKEEERLKKQADLEAKEKLDRDLKELQKNALEGWSGKDKGTVLKVENVKHLGILEHPSIACSKCHTCEQCKEGEECFSMKPCLIYTRQVNEYLHNVLTSFTDFINNNGQLTEGDGFNDDYTPFLKRHNAVLYGAPGTGKTVLVEELVHHLQDHLGDPHNEIRPLKKEIDKLEKELEQLRKQSTIIGRKNPNEVSIEDKLIEKRIENKRKEIGEKQSNLEKLEEQYQVPPVFKIDGAKLQTAGESLGQPNPEQKLIKIIRCLKKEVFEDEFSPKPYVVFVEEADQGKNVMTAGKNNLLEEYKNFLSTTEDKIGLRADAQDPNSIIIIATNNFDQIDPAVTRRGRLGTKLNFNWTPAILEKYSSRGDSEWEKVNWPKNDPGWQFTGNVNYRELYGLCSQFGYSKFADQFTCKKENKEKNPKKIFSKANQIIESWIQMSKDAEWKKNKERELGKFPTGKKVIERKQNKKTGEWEEEEVDEKVCNWILHFLGTFHKYNNDEDLDSFVSANEIQAYDFGDAYATREAIWAIYRRIGEECKILEINNDLLSKAGQNIGVISDTLAAASDVQNQVNEMKDTINQVNTETNRIREHMNSQIKMLSMSIDRIGQSGSANTDELVKRISSLESRMSSLSSSGGSGSSGSSSSNKQIASELKNFLDELEGSLSSLSTSQLFNKIIDFYNANRNK